MAASYASLWRQPDFLKLWASQAISQIGSQVTFLALPLTAVLTLGATPGQMGLLTAMSILPPLLLGLHTGVAVDRREHRSLIIVSDIGQALLLGLIPLAWAMNSLSIAFLYPIAFLSGALALVSNVAHQAFLPAIVARKRLVDANSKTALTGTAAQVLGPTLAGGLIQLLSALLLSRVPATESKARGRQRPLRMWQDIREGLQLAVGETKLRALIASRALLNFFNAVLEAVFVLYIVRELGVESALIGVIFSIGSIGFVIGALLPVRLANRIGIGATMAVGIAVVALSDLIVPLAGGPPLLIMGLLVTAQFFFGLGITVFNVNQSSLRQALVPTEFLGRVGATVRVLADGLTPLGAVLGGFMGATFGLRETLIIAALGELLASMWLWHSPIRTVIQLPSLPNAHALDGNDNAG